MNTVNVTIPANGAYLHVLRAVVGSLGALADAPIDVIDDLRLSVDEACSQLLSTAVASGRLSLRVRSLGDTLDVCAATDGDREPWPPPGAEDSIGWQILMALADEADFERTHEGVAIRFAKTLRPVR